MTADSALPRDDSARDGSSFERALLEDSWRWLNEHHPGWELLLQRLCERNGRMVDPGFLAEGRERLSGGLSPLTGWFTGEHFPDADGPGPHVCGPAQGVRACAALGEVKGAGLLG